MVEGESYLSLGAQIALGHHEHFDGGGYPQHLAGDAIPLAARVVALADVFDALVHQRPYKEVWPVEEAVAYIRERSGKQFDPHVVDAFLAIVKKEYPDLKLESASKNLTTKRDKARMKNFDAAYELYVGEIFYEQHRIATKVGVFRDALD